MREFRQGFSCTKPANGKLGHGRGSTKLHCSVQHFATTAKRINILSQRDTCFTFNILGKIYIIEYSVSCWCVCMHESETMITCEVWLRELGDLSALYVVFFESHQTFHVARLPTCQSVQAAMGVTSESYLHSPHWSHAGRRGVAVLCQPLTWCSAEGLVALVSSLSFSLPFFFFFFSQTWIWRTQWAVEKRELLHTQGHTQWLEYLTWSTDTDCVQEHENNFQQFACTGWALSFSRGLQK